MPKHTLYLLPLEILWLESGSAGSRLLAGQVTGALVSLNISEREVAEDRISKSATPSATLYFRAQV